MTEPNVEQGLLRKADLAKSIGVSPRTIDTWVARRLIPVIVVTPRLYLFDLEAVKKALKNRFEVSARVRG